MADRFLRFPRLLNHRRWCVNGRIPDASFLQQLVYGANHVMAQRRKVIMCTPQRCELWWIGASGTTNLWRARFHTGHGASKLQFKVALSASVDSSAADPRLTFSLTDVGAATTTTRTIRQGVSYGTTTDGPSAFVYREPVMACSPNTTYELLVQAIDYIRPQSLAITEVATTSMSADYYHDLEPGIETPIYDSIRQRILEGYSNMWRRNGAHLLSWSEVGWIDGGSNFPGNQSLTSATWQNLVDRSSTSVSSSTPGYYLGYAPHRLCRISDGNTLNVVFAAYASCSAGTADIRLQDSTGTRCSLTGIGTTPQWYSTTTTIANTNTMTDKVDLQYQKNGGGNVNIRAVSLYTYLA
jgi:hypothetical protein